MSLSLCTFKSHVSVRSVYLQNTIFLYYMPHFFIRKLLLPPKEVLIKKSLPAGIPGRLKNSFNKLFLIHI